MVADLRDPAGVCDVAQADVGVRTMGRLLIYEGLLQESFAVFPDTVCLSCGGYSVSLQATVFRWLYLHPFVLVTIRSSIAELALIVVHHQRPFTTADGV